jgi:hypothetical protein
MPKWKICPNCGEHIPENWNRHEKCGWNVSDEEKGKKSDLFDDMEKAIIESFNVMKKVKQKYPEENIQLDPTKIALTLFIQSRREKLSKR